MKPINYELGAIVREYRLKANMTQMDLAKHLGYDSIQFVSLFERGVSKIPLQTIGQLITLLGIPEKKIMTSLLNAYKENLQSEIDQGKEKANTFHRIKA